MSDRYVVLYDPARGPWVVMDLEAEVETCPYSGASFWTDAPISRHQLEESARTEAMRLNDWNEIEREAARLDDEAWELRENWIDPFGALEVIR